MPEVTHRLSLKEALPKAIKVQTTIGEALPSYKPIHPDTNNGKQRLAGEDPHSKEPQELTDLRQLLDAAKGSQSDKSQVDPERRQGKTPHITDIEWSFDGEIIPAKPENILTLSAQYDQEARRKDLYTEEAKKAINDRSSPRLQRMVFHGKYLGEHWNDSQNKTAEELNLLTILLHDDLFGQDNMRSSESNTGDFISAALQVMRGGHGGYNPFEWTGVTTKEHQPTEKARAIIQKVREMRTEGGGTIRGVTQRDVNGIILSVLACGDVPTALLLAQRSGEIFADEKSFFYQNGAVEYINEAGRAIKGENTRNSLADCMREASHRLENNLGGDITTLETLIAGTQKLIKGGKLTGKDLDRAYDIVDKAKGLIDDQNSVANGVLSRIFGGGDQKNFDISICKKAIDRYPSSKQVEAYIALATIGEGTLIGMEKIPGAQGLKELGLNRLRAIFTHNRDAWYRMQQIVPEAQIRELVGEEGIQKITQDAIVQGKTAEQLSQEIENRATQATRVQVANVVGAELIRRLHPELSLEKQMERQLEKSRKGNTDQVTFGFSNEFSQLRSNDYSGNTTTYDLTTGTAEEKRQKIDKFLFGGIREKPLGYYLKNPEGQKGLEELLRFLQYPSKYRVEIDNLVRYSDEGRKNSEAYKKGLTALGEKLAHGIAFLESECENPEVRRIIQEQFGLGNLVSPDSLIAANDVLADWFQFTASGNYPDTFKAIGDDFDPLKDMSSIGTVVKGDNMTQYESFQVENQPDEDSTKAEILARSLKIGKAQTKAKIEIGVQTALQREQVAAIGIKEQASLELSTLAGPEMKQITQTEARRASLNTDLSNLDESHFFVVPSGLVAAKERLMPSKANKDKKPVIVASDLRAQQEAKAASIKAAEEEIRALNAMVVKKGGSQQEQIRLADEKLAHIAQLTGGTQKES